MLIAFSADGRTFVALWDQIACARGALLASFNVAGWRHDRSACLVDGFCVTELLFAQHKLFRRFRDAANLDDLHDAVMTRGRHLGA
jgi:hypothetical protein